MMPLCAMTSGVYLPPSVADMKPPSKKNTPESQYVCLVRATDKKKKISCRVGASEGLLKTTCTLAEGTILRRALPSYALGCPSRVESRC